MKPNLDVSTTQTEEWRLLSRAAIPQKESTEESVSPADMELVNRLAPTDLQPEDVYVRSMYLCCDKVCPADWGRFTENALRQICSLVVGRAVLRGHDRSSLPLARFYRADIVEREGDTNPDTGAATKWVRAWFYWLRATTGARDLLLNIDGGVYREVSISWRYRTASCSICGEDIRLCDHTAGRTFEGKRCHFIVDEVLDVLEGSLVYRGAESQALLAGSRGEVEGATVSAPTLETIAFGRRNLLLCLSRLPRSCRRAAVSGPVDTESVHVLRALGFWVRRAASEEGSNGWIADRWDPTEAKKVDVWLMSLALGGDGSTMRGELASGGEKPVRARYVIARVSTSSKHEAAVERMMSRALQRWGYIPHFSLEEKPSGCTLFAERSGS